MSLFGTSPEASATKSKTSLFEETQSNNKESGLFGDSASNNNDASTSLDWGFTPSKKDARSNPIKTLLPVTDVPDAYVEAYERMLDAGERNGSSVSLAGAEKLLNGSNLSHADQEAIQRLVLSNAQLGETGLGREEFNVLLALIGLAQEGEEVSLDAVDDRKKRLPVPKLPEIKPQRPKTPPPQPRPIYEPQPVSPPNHRNLSSSMERNARGFTYPETDPWAAPANPRPGVRQPSFTENTNGTAQDLSSKRTTSAFSSSAEMPTGNPQVSSVEDSVIEDSQYWGGNSAYTNEEISSSDYGVSGGQSASRRPPRQPRLTGRHVSQGAEETVIVTVQPDKEGMFLFQYRNYEIYSVRKNAKVFRRYSDFVWLLDCLHKKYPFRQLPLLPPKRVAINGNHIAADALFIERRRRGLTRFANALVRHPVLSQEQLVTMFLTVPTELSSWRKQAQISIQEEFVGRDLPPTLEDSLPPTLEDLFITVRQGVRRSSDAYISLCNMLERLVKRKEGLAGDYLRFSGMLQSVTEMTHETYSIDNNDVPMLNEGITSSSKHIETAQNLLADEAAAWDEGALEDFKAQRDALVSMRDMFDRRDRLSKDNIPSLEKRILANENKLAGVRAKPDGAKKPSEEEKLVDAITKDKQSIVTQHARGVFIKECIRDEIQTFQTSQYRISRMFQEWSQERVKYAELQADNWRRWADEVENMPVGGE